jgi:Tannase and feruloyl esterase
MGKARAIGRFGLCPIFLSLPLGAATCDSLASLKLVDANVTAAQVLPAGSFLPPGPAPRPAALAVYKSLPTFCRVQGVSKPSDDSHIEFEVWLPVAGWNGKYMGIGNGGSAGSITYTYTPNSHGLADALMEGFAASSTDTGHKGPGDDYSFGKGHPERSIDYFYRAIHETSVDAKAIIRTFYGVGAKYSYFDSCSNGGREALMEVQRYPADYDGVLAGAPSNFRTRLQLEMVWVSEALSAEPGSHFPSTKLPAIEAAALAACDARDGLKDGVIGEPDRCKFDPVVLLCKGPETDACLTQPQLTALQKIYSGPRNSKGEQIFPGYEPGGETGAANAWASWITGSGPRQGSSVVRAEGFFASFLEPDPRWKVKNFDFNRDVKALDDSPAALANATNPDLGAFKDRGGKLILYHGWSDAAVPPLSTVNYYSQVVSKMGQKAADFSRLYMIPGMQHCGGGPGPNIFREPITTALERWVENGAAPDTVIAVKYKVDGDPTSGVVRTRPLCPYPQVARYNGSGSIDQASNFVCRSP